MKVLDNQLHQQIKMLSEEGDARFDARDTDGALQKYHQAWRLLPEPKEDWEAAIWLLSAIGDAHFHAGDFKNAVAALSNALQCPGERGNAFIHLRLGESLFELGDRAKALDELTRAYMAAGKEIFQNEHPKYFAHLQSVLKPPPGTASI